jgi:hypothetical protein
MASRMENKKPWVVVDTGSLLTLLLGGEFHQPGYTHAKLLIDCAKAGLIHLVIPDMVAAEFCGSVAPLYNNDIFGPSAHYTSKNIPYGFSYAEQRIALLKEVAALPNAAIIRTNCGDEYLARLTQLMSHNTEYKRVKDSEWPPTQENLRIRLLQPHSQLKKAIKDNTLHGECGLVSSGKNDRGELAVADAVQMIQHKRDPAAKIFVLFEGQDVRGRIIQRLSIPDKTSEHYHQWHTKEALPAFNPSSPRPEMFNHANAATLGDINFLSTKGFLAGLTIAARDLSPSKYIEGHPHWYILHPQETEAHPQAKNGKRYLDEGYEEIIRNVNEKGLGRAYNKYRDRHMMREDENEYTSIDGRRQNAPWAQQVREWLTRNESREQMRGIIKEYSNYREASLAEDTKQRFAEIQHNLQRMHPDIAHACISQLQSQLHQIKNGITR